MRIPRIYYPDDFKENSKVDLTAKAFNHLKVLKLNIGKKVEIFNGKGKVTVGVVENLGRDTLTLKIHIDQPMTGRFHFVQPNIFSKLL